MDGKILTHCNYLSRMAQMTSGAFEFDAPAALYNASF
jgi:hypothetical protein